MIFPSERVRIMVSTKPVDFRKGHGGLAALVKNELHKYPITGTVFIFRSRTWAAQGSGLNCVDTCDRVVWTEILRSIVAGLADATRLSPRAMSPIRRPFSRMIRAGQTSNGIVRHQIGENPVWFGLLAETALQVFRQFCWVGDAFAEEMDQKHCRDIRRSPAIYWSIGLVACVAKYLMKHLEVVGTDVCGHVNLERRRGCAPTQIEAKGFLAIIR